MTETDLRRKCQTYLKENNIIYLHIENNVRYQKYRKPASKVFKGFPDFVIFLPAPTTIFIELKMLGEKLKPEQKEYKERLELLNYHYYIIYTYNDFVDLIRSYI